MRADTSRTGSALACVARVSGMILRPDFTPRGRSPPQPGGSPIENSIVTTRQSIAAVIGNVDASIITRIHTLKHPFLNP